MGDLILTYASPWERALIDEEGAENSAILRWNADGPSLTVFLPQQQVDLKVDERRFHRQLEQKWREMYGPDASIYPLEFGGTTWRVCRRPSLVGDASVFQLVSVHAGRTHQVLVIATGQAQTLPDPAWQLMAGAVWDAPRSLVLRREGRTEAVLAEASPLPAVPATPPAEAQAAAPRPGAEATAAPTGTAWHLMKVLQVLAGPPRLAEMAEAEASRLGEPGLVTGYGLARQQHGLEGFVEGYVWREGPGQRASRSAFARRWHLDWQPAQRLDAGTQDWRLGALEQQLEGELALPQEVGLRLELLALCGPAAELDAALAALPQGGSVAAARLAGLARACPPVRQAAPAINLSLRPQDGTRSVPLAVPAEWLAASPRGGVDKRLLLTLRFPPPGRVSGLGDGLLANAAVYYVYAPGE